MSDHESEIPSYCLIPVKELEAITLKLDKILNAMEEGNKVDPLKEWLTEKAAQAILKKGSTTMWKYRQEDGLVSKKIGNTRYYHVNSIEALLK